MNDLQLRKCICLVNKFLVLIAICTSLAHAELSPEMKKLEKSFHYQTGTITLLKGDVVINTGDKFRYLSPEDSAKLLVDGWGNPPSEELSLGMLVPADLSPLEAKGWGAHLTYEDDSYIDDADAKTINYNNILKEMKQRNMLENIERKKMGYEELHLLGWAEEPHYDQNTHIIYWAKRYGIEEEGEGEGGVINYFIRDLGRHGVFNINVISAGEDFPEVKKAAPELLKVVSFAEGKRYEDHRFWDTTSSYGLGALVAGGAVVAAKKVGLIGLVILFAKKFFIVIIAAIAGFVKMLFGRKDKN